MWARKKFEWAFFHFLTFNRQKDYKKIEKRIRRLISDENIDVNIDFQKRAA